MLINIRISELQSNTSNSIPLAIAIAIFLNYPIIQVLPFSFNLVMFDKYSYFNVKDTLYNFLTLAIGYVKKINFNMRIAPIL